MVHTRGAVGRTAVARVAAAGEGGVHVLDAAREEADDAATVVAVGSLGHPALEPLVAVTVDGETALFPDCTPPRARELVAALESGALPAADASAVLSHDAETPTFPRPDDGPLGVGSPAVLAPCGWANPVAPADFAPLVATGDHDALTTVERFGLRGRGRGDARTDRPIAPAWHAAREAEGDPVVVVNANEADPRVAGDALICEGAAVAVLDAAAAVADAVGASTVVVYGNDDGETARRRLRTAAAELSERLDVAFDVVSGPDRYVAGEETMALESLEGADRLEARVRPPDPAEHGLYGRPTVVHTPRTLLQLRALLTSPAAFDAEDADPGTRLVTVSGDVPAPATVELPTGGDLTRALAAVDPPETVKFACVGGRFGGVTRSLDVPPAAPALDAAGLGTNGAVELFDGATCALVVAGERTDGAAADNCGRCVPCREGSVQLRTLLRGIYDGDFDEGDVRELTRTMAVSSTCAFGRDAARTVSTALDAFEAEFRAHADGRCPAGTCEMEHS